MAFIRFNPDAYRDSSGIRRNPELETRLRLLRHVIVETMARIRLGLNVGSPLEVMWLYHDGADLTRYSY